MSSKALIFWGLLVCSFFTISCVHSFAATNNKNHEKSWLTPELQDAKDASRLEMRWKNKEYQLPSAAQRNQIISSIEKILNKLETPDVNIVKQAAKSLKGSSYRLTEYNDKLGHWLILGPDRTDQAGAGYYVFRLGKLQHELVLQAPHAIFDIHTDVITKEIFRSFPIRAAFFSNWQRYGSIGRKPYKNSPYDLAHNPDTLYQDMTGLWLKRMPQSTFVQLHGFESRVDKKGIHFILSPGTKKQVGPWFPKLTKTFDASYGEESVAVYPEVRGLGATTNVQGRLIKNVGGRFLHIEMSEAFRYKLKKSKKARLKLGQTIIEGLK